MREQVGGVIKGPADAKTRPMQRPVNGKMGCFFLSGERGTTSLWLVVESRMLYVRAKE